MVIAAATTKEPLWHVALPACQWHTARSMEIKAIPSWSWRIWGTTSSKCGGMTAQEPPGMLPEPLEMEAEASRLRTIQTEIMQISTCTRMQSTAAHVAWVKVTWVSLAGSDSRGHSCKWMLFAYSSSQWIAFILIRCTFWMQPSDIRKTSLIHLWSVSSIWSGVNESMFLLHSNQRNARRADVFTCLSCDDLSWPRLQPFLMLGDVASLTIIANCQPGSDQILNSGLALAIIHMKRIKTN